MEEEAALPDRVRAACAWVAARARSVRIDEDAVAPYATEFPDPAPEGLDPATHFTEGDREGRAAFVTCLDAINFGSGWWPTIRKRAGLSGYFTIAAGVTERFRREGPWRAAELCEISAGELAAVLGQDPDHPLMADYAATLRDVGERVRDEHGGSFAALADAAGGSAPALAGLLAGWDSFSDLATYDGRPVPFFKRAQIAAADIDRAGIAALGGQERLTAFADNLVPHVLRLDGILRLDSALAEAIDAGELLAHGSEEEVELRACAVHAVELIAAAGDGRLRPLDVDALLWARGGGPRYKAAPRPRCRNTAY